MVMHKRQSFFNTSDHVAVIETILSALWMCRSCSYNVSNIELEVQEIANVIRFHCVKLWTFIYSITRIRKIIQKCNTNIKVVSKPLNRPANYISEGKDTNSPHFVSILKYDAVGYPNITYDCTLS
ncbi:unnamed protein product [Cuscuta epithymum]|uniref:Uncharacterized protein n=1 Tax=Cuscuta epithymum TaxID=186058 RepID=A0AAV0FET8_9ASTE|nr:unnamed protein product [Cuscuta epithymum]